MIPVSLLLALDLTFPEMAGWGVVTVLISAGLGFLSGRLISANGDRQRLMKASRNIDECFDLLLQSFRNARQVCRTMQDFPELTLSVDQSARLETEQTDLMRTWKQCWDRIVESESGKHVEQTTTDFRTIAWDRSNVDPATGLPDRQTLIANLSHLLSFPAPALETHGLLMARLDNGVQMKLRFGESGCLEFRKQIIRLIEPFIRTEDFICQASNDTIAVLFPALDFQLGKRLSENLRNVIKEHRFRLDDEGPEVLVTASLGYAICYPREHFEIARQRGENAVAEARRMGRNQLCLHDGNRLILCSHVSRSANPAATLRTFAVPSRH